MTHGTATSSDDWVRLEGGWRRVCSETRHFVKGLRNLPAACVCGTGVAHLTGWCTCLSRNGSEHVNCLVRLRTIRWTLDALLDDAQHLFDAAASSTPQRADAGCDVALATLRDDLIEVGEILGSAEIVASRFRRDSRPESFHTLKDLAEVLLTRVNQVSVIVSDVGQQRAQP